MTPEEIKTELQKITDDVHTAWYSYESAYHEYRNRIHLLIKKIERASKNE